MNSRDEVRAFLRARRARLTPEEVGLPDFGGFRRVAGLRREEVALLAGISPDYYTHIERGEIAGVSERVIDGLARALRLDARERAYLMALARAEDDPEPP